MSSRMKWNLASAVALLAMITVAQSAIAQTIKPTTTPPTPTKVAAPTPPITDGEVDPKAFECFTACGKNASLTVLPVFMTLRASPQVGEVVAMLLERGGMTELETSAIPFVPAPKADLAATAVAFSEFVCANPISTDFALFSEFRTAPTQTPADGFSEIRTVIVTSKGEIVWTDQLGKGNAEFDRNIPREPMQCCLLVAQRVRPLLNLEDPSSQGAPPGKITKRWEQRTGIPDKAQLDAINARKKTFTQNATKSTIVIYPVQTTDACSVEGAKYIANLLNEKKVLSRANASLTGPMFEVEPSMNEQKTLWTMANTFSEFVRKNPPTEDYALFADYLMDMKLGTKLGTTMVGGVHFAICNKKGELVWVDLQNDNWPDFQKINPKTREACDGLVAQRIADACE